MKHSVILVGADKGGVGKTTTCRGLLDYLIERNVLSRAFDTETPRGTLQRFHPDITEIVDLSQTAGQMRIIDTCRLRGVRPGAARRHPDSVARQAKLSKAEATSWTLLCDTLS